ncbi:ABC transporter family substrate-binding protein [Actinoplanes sp. KI2]|uniref:ABC transporter family substrate-binding protein n=1 Tax=Actinoplanes sp. KI2 TaxID=2983315 RepID=UPI0021D60B0B|nr:ABC transporter family substrate-binding protein [Actinoplanes sp. KI2]MCU7729070.1 ABC transporter family substrate-binding protein [Actinoplanes sp. KI2]
MKRLGAAAAVLLLTALPAGCGTSAEKTPYTPTTGAASATTDYNPQPYENVRDGGTLRLAGQVIEQGNPFQADANLAANRLWFWYNADTITYSPTGEVLYNPDYFSDVKTEVVGGNQRVTITINPKATFNDGTPIDYRAVEATWKANNGTNKDYYAGDTIPYARISSVHAGVNDKQAVIEFTGVDAWWSALFTTLLNPEAAADAKTFNTAYLKKVQPQWGAGPYTVTKYDAATGGVTFERNPKWWGRKGKLDKRIIIGLDTQAAINAFRNGELDYIGTGDADGLKQISGVANTEIRRGGSPFEYILLLNAKAPLLGDLAVRKAILEGIDREQIAAINLQGLDYREPLPGSAIFYSFQKGYHDNVADVLTADPAAARKELDAAGWVTGSDGIRAKDGKKLALSYTLTGSVPLEKATATAFAAQLKRLGVKVDIRTVSENDFDSVVSGRKFDLFFAGNRSLDPFGARSLDGFFGSTNNENITGTGTPELDRKIKAAAEIADPDRQIARANELEREGLAQYGLIPLFSGPSIYGCPRAWPTSARPSSAPRCRRPSAGRSNVRNRSRMPGCGSSSPTPGGRTTSPGLRRRPSGARHRSRAT